MRNIYNKKDRGNCQEPVYVPGEEYSFYMNFENLINDPDFANFRLNIIDPNFPLVFVASNIGILKKHIINADFYNIYCEFTFPALKNREYQFVIRDIVKGVNKATSNIILCENERFDDITQRVEYSHIFNIDGFYYESLPGYTNKFRIQTSKIDYQFTAEKTQYRNITGNHELRTFTSFRDKKIKVEAYYFDEDAHEAMAAMIDCKNMLIDGTRYTATTGYNVITNQLRNKTKGEFDAIEDQSKIIQQKPIALLVLNQVSILKIGSIVPLTGTASINRGVATGYDFYKLNVQEPAQPQVSNVHNYGNYTVLAGVQEMKVIVAYLLDALSGNASATANIEGAYPLFATTVTIGISTEQALVSMKSIEVQITLIAESGGSKQFFEIPQLWLDSKPLTEVQYYVNHLSKFEDSNKLSDFTVSNVVNVVSGNNVNYKRFTYSGIDRGSILIKLIF